MELKAVHKGPANLRPRCDNRDTSLGHFLGSKIYRKFNFSRSSGKMYSVNLRKYNTFMFQTETQTDSKYSRNVRSLISSFFAFKSSLITIYLSIYKFPYKVILHLPQWHYVYADVQKERR